MNSIDKNTSVIYFKYKEKQVLKKAIFILFAILMCSCIVSKVSKDDVLSFMDNYFAETKQNNFNIIASHYSDDFYKNTSKEEWETVFIKVHSIIGKLESIELESWNAKSMLATSGSGTTYTLIYNNKYENGIVQETINIFIPNGESEIKILGHNFNSNLFLKL